MALRTRILKLSNLRCVTQQASRLRAMSTQSTQTSPKEGPATATEEMKPGQTHFGFQVVAEEEKTKKVHEVFETVAEKYDLMNDVMSMGIHRMWKDIFMCRLAPQPETKLLDMAGGTGDIAFRYIKYLQNLGPSQGTHSSVTVCDINQAMLDVGKQRAQKLGYTPESCGVEINWKCADAERLDLPDDSYTAYTIAFGIRNCTHIDKVLEEAYRVLTPGGRFMCLEFSQLPNDTLQWVYDQYSFQVIPVLGQLFAGQWKPYQYLVESIRQFPNQEKFKSMIEDAGFRQVTYENLTFGTCAIHSGFKI
ncbi:2-methoxy-6-polyprenyl-1,4-benzoquinol methylase, mitochondrial [Spodoptera frugiperda]|uniref:2-methoxy-6-polyprenyl-1,4-benzoquinol methylase, mitochondrial n=1 Tax=Spodoptera frugiperda TaxID=7108 RepID=A0A9R0DCN3_SPOFR|nr:2-methoxy-6-polyprenyl-1,4-benzoquinol methylase, mitochondrial [Spodoptera frugiperda]